MEGLFWNAAFVHIHETFFAVGTTALRLRLQDIVDLGVDAFPMDPCYEFIADTLSINVVPVDVDWVALHEVGADEQIFVALNISPCHLVNFHPHRDSPCNLFHVFFQGRDLKVKFAYTVL